MGKMVGGFAPRPALAHQQPRIDVGDLCQGDQKHGVKKVQNSLRFLSLNRVKKDMCGLQRAKEQQPKAPAQRAVRPPSCWPSYDVFSYGPSALNENALRLCKSRWMSSQANLTLVKEENGVRWITLNNPKKRNALSLLMLEKLKQDIFRDVNNIGLRCIILNSSSSIFSSGHDLKELKSSSQDVQDEIFQKCTELMIGIQKVPLPVIAQVKGLAAAAGCQLIASCDMVIATENAQFSTPGAAVGLFCSTPGIAITRAVPRKVASYMLFTGNNITAQEAFQSGLISKIVPEEKLEEVTADVVQAIIKKSRSVLALGKEFFYQQVQEDIETAYRLGAKVMVQNLAIRDAHEGISAFFEKRIPEWQHTLDKPS